MSAGETGRREVKSPGIVPLCKCLCRESLQGVGDGGHETTDRKGPGRIFPSPWFYFIDCSLQQDEQDLIQAAGSPVQPGAEERGGVPAMREGRYRHLL